MAWVNLGDVFVISFSGETITELRENNIPLSRVFTLAGMTAGSFYHDLSKKRLYLWASDTSNPNSNGKTYIIYSWLGMCSNSAEFGIQGGAEIFYMPIVDAIGSPPISEQINNLFTGNITYSFGDIRLTDAGYGYKNLNYFIWENARVAIKFGDLRGSYESYKTIFSGNVTGITISDGGVNLHIADTRLNLFTSIPPGRYRPGFSPYIPTGTIGDPRPLLFGEKKNIEPILVDESLFKYEVSQTSFSFGTFPLQSIDAVYIDSVIQNPGDYTVNLSQGWIRFNSDPDGEVTIDAKGLRAGYNFGSGVWTGAYTQNIADITYFLLRCQGITSGDIREDSFEMVQSLSDRLTCGDYITQEVEFNKKAVELQSSGMFHIVTSPEGQIYLRPYGISEEPAASIGNENISGFSINKSITTVFPNITIRYNRVAAGNQLQTIGGAEIGEYSYYNYELSKLRDIYKSTSTIIAPTILTNQQAAENAALRLAEIFSKQIQTVSFVANWDAIEWPLLSVISVSREAYIDGAPYAILDNQPVLIIKKSILWNGTVNIGGILLPPSARGGIWVDHNGDPIVDHAGTPINT